MQQDRKATEAQGWVPGLGRWGTQKQGNFFAFTVKTGHSSKYLYSHRGGNEAVNERGEEMI